MKKIVVALVGLAVFAPGALAATHFLKVSPRKVAAGKTVTVSGSVAHGCRTGHPGDIATIYSRAFKGITKKSFAGIPAVTASLSKSKGGAFSVGIKLSRKVKPATYSVGGRCGGGNFGSAKLQVTKPSSSSPPSPASPPPGPSTPPPGPSTPPPGPSTPPPGPSSPPPGLGFY